MCGNFWLPVQKIDPKSSKCSSSEEVCSVLVWMIKKSNLISGCWRRLILLVRLCFVTRNICQVLRTARLNKGQEVTAKIYRTINIKNLLPFPSGVLMNSAAVRMGMFVASVLFMAGKIAACGLFLRWNLHMRPASSLDLKTKQGLLQPNSCATHTCFLKKNREGVEKSEPLPL